jgi:hypothetical protein
MARTTLIAFFLFVAALLLAVALFVAGAIWRGRMTSGTTDFRTLRNSCSFAGREIGRIHPLPNRLSASRR